MIVRRGLAVIVRDWGFPCAAWTRGHGASGRGSQGKVDRGSDGCGIVGVGADGRTKINVTSKNVHVLFFLVIGH